MLTTQMLRGGLALPSNGGTCSLLPLQGARGLLLVLGWDVVELRYLVTLSEQWLVTGSAETDLPEGFV